MQNKEVVLTLKDTYRDGGSEKYKGSDGKMYWRCYKFRERNHPYYGKIFEGDINDFPKVKRIASGTFIIQHKEFKETIYQ